MTDNGDKKLTVPKFSSFKPKAPVPTPSARQSAGEAIEDLKDRADGLARERRSRHESRHRDERRTHRHEHRSERRHHELKRSRSRSKEVIAAAKKPDAHSTMEDRSSIGHFFIDKMGDPLIRKYGGNDRGRVPLYRRGGRGRVLGSDGFLVIHRDGPRERFSIRRPGEGASGLRDRALFQLKTHRVKTIRIRPRDDFHQLKVDAEEDFVPLSKSSKRRRTEEAGSSGDEQPSYRSIEGKAKPHEFSDSDVDYDTDQDGEISFDAEEPLKQRSIQLSRQVKEHPEDIAGWLELIAHQDVLLRASESLSHEVTKSEIHSFAEIKISMYESALAQARNSEDEERLLLGLMLEGAKVWSGSKLDSRWADVAKRHESSFCLWKARIDHRLTNLSTFQYNEIKALHVDRLRDVAKQTSVSTAPEPGYSVDNEAVPRYQQMIYVFLRTTRFIYDAGYRELAVAAWQALFELSLQRPTAYEAMPDSEVVNSFKEFWEGEATRIGEKNAVGWNHYVQANGAVDPPEPQRDDETIAQSRDVYKSWGATERLRAINSRTPGRATDDVLEDDPYRVVMFSDIEELIFVIPSGVLSVVWKQLVDGFLLFCWLPPAFRSSKWTEAAERDTLISGGLALLEKDVIRRPNQPDVMDETKRVPNFKQDGAQFAVSADLLFASSDWFSCLCGWTTVSKTEAGPVNLAWVADSLRQLIALGNCTELAEYSFAMDVVNDSNNIKKRARALIKQSPSNPALYNAYALAELANDNADVGRQVMQSATSLISTSNDARGLVLWKTWAWMELAAGNRTSAVVRLCAAVDETLRNAPGLVAPSPPQILKARQTLLDVLESQLSTRQLDDAILNAEVLALLVYLTSEESSEPTSDTQGSITMAMERIWSVSSELCAQKETKSQPHERLLQAGARLLYHHASRGPFRRTYLREQLNHCIELFPRNTIFLSLFSWASITFGIDDPVRDILRKVALTDANDSISNRIFAIRYELERGNVHSTQAAFERALDSPTCRTNAELWRCYIRFSYATKQLRPKAKDFFFRGLRHCPWSKDLALEAYTTLINVMDEFELRSVFNTMANKGLRIHVDLDEFVAKHENGKTKRR